jgi:hypothetical protein
MEEIYAARSQGVGNQEDTASSDFYEEYPDLIDQ